MVTPTPIKMEQIKIEQKMVTIQIPAILDLFLRRIIRVV